MRLTGHLDDVRALVRVGRQRHALGLVLDACGLQLAGDLAARAQAVRRSDAAIELHGAIMTRVASHAQARRRYDRRAMQEGCAVARAGAIARSLPPPRRATRLQLCRCADLVLEHPPDLLAQFGCVLVTVHGYRVL